MHTSLPVTYPFDLIRINFGRFNGGATNQVGGKELHFGNNFSQNIKKIGGTEITSHPISSRFNVIENALLYVLKRIRIAF